MKPLSDTKKVLLTTVLLLGLAVCAQFAMNIAVSLIGQDRSATGGSEYSSDISEKLFTAVRKGDTDSIQKIFSKDSEAAHDATYSSWGCFGGTFDTTPLIESVLNPEVVAVLLKNGADPNKADRNGLTPLMKTMQLMNSNRTTATKSLHLLLENGANIHQTTKRGNLLHFARSPQDVAYLIQMGVEVNQPNEYGVPPLAAMIGLSGYITEPIQIIELLIKAGANVQFKGEQGQSLLHNMAFHSQVDLVDILVKSGVDINAQDNFGNTPLDMALAFDKGSMWHFWQDKDKTYGRYWLNRYPDVIDAMLNNGATLTDTSRKYLPWSGNTKLVSDWLKSAENVDERDAFGRTPFLAAAQLGNIALMRILVTAGADVNATDEKGRNAINHVTQNRNTEPAIIEELLRLGANPDLKPEFGISAREFIERRLDQLWGKSIKDDAYQKIFQQIREVHRMITATPIGGRQ